MHSSKFTINAAVGIIQRKDGFVLLAERPAGKPWAGYWEFPGGKVELNESPLQALKRELQEELGILITAHYPWVTRTFDYPEKYDALGKLESTAKTVRLNFFLVTKWKGEARGLENQLISWQKPGSLNVTPMLPANTPIFTALSFPSIFAISNLKELGEFLFFERLKIALENGLRMLQIREKHLPIAEYLFFIKQVILITKPYEVKVFLNLGDMALGLQLISELGVSGLHLSSFELMQLHKRPEGILCGASCHNQQELLQAEKLGLDYVMLSPVLSTQSHEDATHLGWDTFGGLIKGYSLPVYALGGMHVSDLHRAKQFGAHGIAMLRSIWN